MIHALTDKETFGKILDQGEDAHEVSEFIKDYLREHGFNKSISLCKLHMLSRYHAFVLTLASKEIVEFLDTFMAFIFHDIKSAIDGKANYLAALGLSVYTEQLGGLYNGDFDRLAGNYTSFIKDYFDPLYQNQEKNAVNYINNHPSKFPKLIQRIKQKKPISGLYALIRSGLVHEFLMKGESVIYMHSTTADCGILITENASPKLKFIVEKYFDDFKKAFERYYNDIVCAESGLDRKQQLEARFSEAANSLPFNPFKI